MSGLAGSAHIAKFIAKCDFFIIYLGSEEDQKVEGSSM